ncbi:MAG: hypothetical protein R2750_11655 [Bacteroidales bacterium]
MYSWSDGYRIVEPLVEKEQLIIATLDYNVILEERHNFDPSGHYSRPDVISMSVNRKRQGIINQIMD